jgi:hypothetical protein
MNNSSSDSPGVDAELNYVLPTTERTYMYTYNPPSGVPTTNVKIDPQVQFIRNGRAGTSTLSLERQGFALLKMHTSLFDFSNSDDVRRIYYPEAEQLLMTSTGADRAIVFDHTFRRHIAGAIDRKHRFRQPVHLVHVDYSDNSGPRRVRHFLEDADGSPPPSHVKIVNLWRSTQDLLRDAPLAVCDALSVRLEDQIQADLIYPSGPGEVLLLSYNPEHRWFYFPEMNPDEALIFKCYDSRPTGCARFTPHTAFVDDTLPVNSALRESIELRALLIYFE